MWDLATLDKLNEKWEEILRAKKGVRKSPKPLRAGRPARVGPSHTNPSPRSTYSR